MITLTKEWLLTTIAELEEERGATPGAVNEDAAKALAAMKLALASLEAEPVAFRSKLQPPSAIGSERWDYTDHRQPDAFELENCVIERLYTAPPAQEVPEVYNIGDATMRHIFTPAVITDVSDMQAVFDQIETVLAGMWQPASVSDSLLSELLAIAKNAAEAADECANSEWGDESMEHSTAIADWERRAAMLQDKE
ncbi:TPA: hypothetical protein ONE11_000959 [Enterobacter hormaechei subsp. steigerwaltii]|nr:hypothetical protein [Enterobacter hormaechei subsp. steigerwaltii]